MKVFGLSHIGFSCSQIQLPSGSLLTPFYEDWKQRTFSNVKFKENLLRSNQTKELKLYKTSESGLPVIETLYSNSSVSRSADNYGLLFDSDFLEEVPSRNNLHNSKSRTISIQEFFQIKYSFYSNHLQCEITFTELQQEFGIKSGMWLRTTEDHFIIELFEEILNVKTIYKNEHVAFYKSKIVQKPFGEFLWGIFYVDQPVNLEKNYQDDLGLSTLAFFCEDIESLLTTMESFPIQPSNQFKLEDNNKIYKGQLVGDFKYPFFEFLETVS